MASARAATPTNGANQTHQIFRSFFETDMATSCTGLSWASPSRNSRDCSYAARKQLLCDSLASSPGGRVAAVSFAEQGGADGRGQLFTGGVLEDVPQSTGGQRLADEGRVAVDRHEDDAGVGVVAADGPRRRDAVQ